MTKLKDLFKKNTDFQGEEKGTETREGEGVNVPEGLFVKCPKCSQPVYKEDVVAHSYCCPKCGGHFRIKAKTRIKMLTDYHSFEPWFENMEVSDPLNYPEYPEKIEQLKEKTHLDEAVRIGKATIEGIEVVIGVMDARFLMGSMGYVVGEKITASFERAIEEKLPVILFCCSGGARMQEGMRSLMQMAKTSAAIKRHSKAGLLYIPVLTDPTMGGVTASFAMLGDIILAESQALIGFAGPRVIAQTIGQKLPEGFQRAEFLLEHGMVDEVVEREELKMTLSRLLRLHCNEKEDYIVATAAKYEKNQRETAENLTAWERVQIARGKERPTSLDYIQELFDEFTELHGDRAFRDDGAIVGGVAWFEGNPVTVIGVQKGKTTVENVKRNFGMPSPEGYRKALRLMRQAEKFHRPIITFVDTPGAFCGVEAEERGQGEAIARNLMEMSDLEVPILSIVIGEGGSGGALALAVGNEVWMMENATYSILSPEGFASILWKDSKRANEAAQVMKITAQDLKQMEIIDRIIPEWEEVTVQNMETVLSAMREPMREFISIYEKKTVNQIVTARYERFRRM